MKTFIPLAIAVAALATAGIARADYAATITIFQDKCAMCHGADGKAQTVMGKQLNMKDWSDGKTLNAMSDADVGSEIHVGKALMPAFTALSDEEVKALVGYIRHFQK